MFKIIIVIIFALIIISLFAGLYFLLKDQSRSRRTVQSLILRVSLAAFLLLIILIGFYSGELQLRTPFPLMPSAQQSPPQQPIHNK
ncbi:twin transmembrane helix small protein [Amphritea pacifica]|uniref:Twin transmembrane helix small protein n=1 Tax=Amphritea pacifica TaxID=2811233 RepID=A0ABS2WD88_9GAMM|nr:twin transmembrane helix small protein [Amphritea pacifica]MBN0989690.1 twin transmembrane helix small protein [Amphritea pacifica]MBN1008963.1 twin transmembrane helix small protein [Amphritea pacifica]